MLIIGMYIGMAVFGIIALVRGKLTLTKNKIVVGIPARLLGALGLTPFPTAVVLVMVFMAAKGGLDKPEQFERDNLGAITAIQVATTFGVLVVMFVIGFAVAVSPAEAKRRERGDRYDDEDDYERPRRRGTRDDEEEDERPRRGRRDEEEDEDRPRRRRSADDDDEDERPRRRRDDRDDDEEDRDRRPRRR